MLPFTIERLAEQLRARTLRSIDLVEQCLAQIERCEPELHAWVMIDGHGAREQAERLDRELEAGTDRGPLHGIPIGIKDIVDVRGWPTLAGSPLRAGQAATEDAELVRLLRQQGAVLLGKTVTTEFAGFDPAATRNPWNLSRTPGGSSSGSAAAVAMRMCLAAVGSQTGGSITRPASFCGVYGCKPTAGLVSSDGLVPVSHRLDHPGPIGRSVRDLATMLDAMAGDGRQRAELHELLQRPARSEPPRLAVLEPFFFQVADAEVIETTRAAIADLQKAGAQVEFIDLPPEFEGVHRRHRAIMAHDTARQHQAVFQRQPEMFGQQMRAMIEEGLRVESGEYALAVAGQEPFAAAIARLCRSADALLTPATVTAAPSMETTGDPRFNSPWSYGGVPTVSLPCAVSSAGLPISLQLIAGRRADARLLAVAEWCEQKLAFDREPPLLGEA